MITDVYLHLLFVVLIIDKLINPKGILEIAGGLTIRCIYNLLASSCAERKEYLRLFFLYLMPFVKFSFQMIK